MKLKKSINLVIILLAFAIKSQCQPRLVGLEENPVLKTESLKPKQHNNLKKIKNAQSDQPLFIDDFSYSSVYPDKSNWMDSAVFINNDFCSNPMTIGVATFDATDNTGTVYTRNNNPPATFRADSLTSKPIDLSGRSKVYLSFYYQPKGLGNTPESQDSLFLEYLNPADTSWKVMWSASYAESQGTVFEQYNTLTPSARLNWHPKISPADTFKLVILPVDINFLFKTFQFRFRNLASIPTNAADPGKMANCDFWNLDYVYLNDGRSLEDTIMHESAMVYPSTSQIKDYESVPWKHYIHASNSLLQSHIIMTYRNLDTIDDNRTRYCEIKELDHNIIDTIDNFGNHDIPAFSKVVYPDEVFSSSFFPIDRFKDSAAVKFEISTYLSSKSSDLKKGNDIAKFYQIFRNYYAYDDSIPELGFGISGNGAVGATAAISFKNAFADTLQGFYIYFNHSYKDTNANKYFEPIVWKDFAGKPGDILFDSTETDNYIINVGNLGKYKFYKINPTFISQDQTYYIGWKQVNEDFLNVGFDVNRNSSSKTFFNYTGSWESSTLKGTIMIRPVFGEKKKNPIDFLPDIELNTVITLYPNPAKDYINVLINKSLSPKPFNYSIFNFSGQIVASGIYTFEQIPLNGLPSGIYFLQLRGNEINKMKKFIIAH